MREIKKLLRFTGAAILGYIICKVIIRVRINLLIESIGNTGENAALFFFCKQNPITANKMPITADLHQSSMRHKKFGI